MEGIQRLGIASPHLKKQAFPTTIVATGWTRSSGQNTLGQWKRMGCEKHSSLHVRRRMTTEAKSNPKWKRALWLALKIYAGLCTLLVTLYLALVLWRTFFPQSPISSKTIVTASFGDYVAKESPKRADHFCRLAIALGTYCKEGAVPAADMFKYLGKPDLIAGTEETGTLVYLYEHPGATNRWAVYASFKDGKLRQIRINDATVNDHSGYRAYSTP
jgi:hypothetical protein